MAPRRWRQASAMQIPTAREIAAREAYRAHIRDIDAQILALESSIRSLRDERKLLKRRLDGYTYPVLTLPNEIVAHIFVHFLPVYPRCPPITGLFSPTTLGHVCHKWREIALSTPALWRAISLYLDDKMKLEPNLRVLESWLKRSGSCPLSIRLLEDVGDEVPPDLDLDPFFQAIVSHCARWQYLKTYMRLHHISKAHTPFLRSLSIGWRSDELGRIASIEAPQLQKLTLERYRDVFATIVPWAQLKTLHVTFISPHQFVDILHQTVNLVHCKLAIIPPENNNAALDDTRPLRLLHLETLVLLDWSDNNAPTGWVGMLTLPALCRLQISENFLGQNHIDTLLSLLSRSGCSLQELYILDSDLRSAMYHTALPSVPSVVFGRRSNIGNGLFAPDSSDNVYETDVDGSLDSDKESRSSNSDEQSQSSDYDEESEDD